MTKRFIGQICIIRTYLAGVWYGVVKELEGTNCILGDAIRIWKWDGACSISELAVNGTISPDECMFAVAIKDECGVYLPQVIEVIRCSPESIKSLERVKTWKKG